MLGHSLFTMMKCSCGISTSLSDTEMEEFHNLSIKEFMGRTKICTKCGAETTYQQAIIDGIADCNVFTQMNLICNVKLMGTEQVIAGKPHVVNLDKEFDTISFICANNSDGKLIAVAPEYIPNDTKSFRIITSCIDGGSKYGDTVNISWILYGNRETNDIPIWQSFLVESIRSIYNRQYKPALLMSFISFESFVDTVLYGLLLKKGLEKEAANTIIIEMNRLSKKLKTLLKQLDNVDFTKCKVKEGIFELIHDRNIIAHGGDGIVDRDKAVNALRTILGAMFFVISETTLPKEKFFNV